MDKLYKVRVREKYACEDHMVEIFPLKMPNVIAEMAKEFAKHFAVVAGTPDGEDSAGRSKLRLQTVEETTQRACDMAAAMWAEFDRRGWIVDLPDPYEGDEDGKEVAD